MKFLISLIAVLVTLLTSSTVFAQEAKPQASTKPNYDFAAKTIAGDEITLSGYYGKKYILVGMWATW